MGSVRTVADKLPSGTLSEDTRLEGSVEGDLRVASGVTVELLGAVGGDLHIEPGANVLLYGAVSGSVFNRGHVEIHGVVVGTHADADGGTSGVSPEATILRKR